MQSLHTVHNMNDPQFVLDEPLLLAVPFKWEVSPGIPASSPSASSSSSTTSPASAESLMNKLVLPRPTIQLSAKPQPLSSPRSPRSPRSISLSKRMRALLQGRSSLCRTSVTAEEYSSSSSSVPVSPSSSSSSCSSDGEQASSFMPLKSVSTMLVELWHSGVGYGESYQHLFSGNDQIESPTAGNSFNSLSTEASDFYCFEPVEAEATAAVVIGSMSNGLESLLKSDRFHVEHSGSPSLLESRPGKPRRLQSALKSSVKSTSTAATVKKVRFADEQQQHSGENSSTADASSGTCSSALLSRYSSRTFQKSEWPPALSQALTAEDDKENNNVSSSGSGKQQVEYLDTTEQKTTTTASRPSRPRRDLSELVMQIVQADAAELAAKQKSRSPIKSMFFKSSSSTSRWS